MLPGCCCLLPKEISLVFLQIYQAAPQVLTPVMPSVLDELRDQDDTKRLGALDLLGKLFSMQGSDACSVYPELFLEFLRRSTDQKASPSQMLSSLPGCAVPGKHSATSGLSLRNVLWRRLSL